MYPIEYGEWIAQSNNEGIEESNCWTAVVNLCWKSAFAASASVFDEDGWGVELGRDRGGTRTSSGMGSMFGLIKVESNQYNVNILL